MNCRKDQKVFIVIFLVSVITCTLVLLLHFLVLSRSDGSQEDGSNVLESWQGEPIAYGSLFPPSNKSSTLSMLERSSSYDVIIIGAGMAGLSAASKLCESDKRVLVVEANVRQLYSSPLFPLPLE